MAQNKFAKKSYAMFSFNRPEFRAQYYDKDIFKAWFGKLKNISDEKGACFST